MATRPTETIDEMLARARNAALDAGCAVIQQYLGVTSGDFAGLFFSDADDDVARVLRSYLINEIAEAGPARRFVVDGSVCSFHYLLRSNSDDGALIDWARNAKVGDVFPAFVECKRVA